MNRLTYKEAYDKIIDAYFKGEIKPMKATFCFCGTLSHDAKWRFGGVEYPYSAKEYDEMETALFSPLCELPEASRRWHLAPNYENVLFEGMCAALDVLKEIHRSRGEDVDGEIKPFTKRQLENTHI